ncbi:hypothetical protein ANN_17205 [Periplaneta americana]|uniref:Uncharacterized protein n=1 Tax=Periplaneta americana TaxID=6978 RepID=A0ABQ8SUD6_PERAM|nr:hypothetical protein ANN_17205 [Periplaneta americana]
MSVLPPCSQSLRKLEETCSHNTRNKYNCTQDRGHTIKIHNNPGKPRTSGNPGVDIYSELRNAIIQKYSPSVIENTARQGKYENSEQVRINDFGVTGSKSSVVRPMISLIRMNLVKGLYWSIVRHPPLTRYAKAPRSFTSVHIALVMSETILTIDTDRTLVITRDGCFVGENYISPIEIHSIGSEGKTRTPQLPEHNAEPYARDTVIAVHSGIAVNDVELSALAKTWKNIFCHSSVALVDEKIEMKDYHEALISDDDLRPEFSHYSLKLSEYGVCAMSPK